MIVMYWGKYDMFISFWTEFWIYIILDIWEMNS